MEQPVKVTTSLLLAQSLFLGACAVPAPDRPGVPTAGSEAVQANAPAAAPALRAQRPGVGVVESASVASLPSSSSAAAGASAGPTMAYRLKMEDGSTQNVVQAGERLEVGDRVEVTSDGRLVRRSR
jgi:hypothetical protein